MALEMKYFVLKPKAKKPDDHFAAASQDAMNAYADSIQEFDSALASELRMWANREAVSQMRPKMGQD
jgi:hypothetical protein